MSRPQLRGLAAALLAALGTTWATAGTLQITVTGKDGLPLPDAVVLVEPASGARGKAPPPVQTSIAQHKMQFVPAVSVVPVGSRVRFTNQDGWDHHVRGVPAGMAGLTAGAGAGFELRLAGQVSGQPPASTDVVMGQPGPLQLGCHLHGSMRGFVYVADTPWVVKTDAQGVATLGDVPEGAARVRVWHPDQLVEGAPVPVQVQAVSTVTVPTQVVPRRRRL
jgi:plastocyanin